MSDSDKVELTLNKAIKGSGKLTLTFYITNISVPDDPPAYSCTLTTIALKGLPVAEGMEFDMEPENANDDGFATTKRHQTWKLGENSIDVDDDDGNTQTIDIMEVILKSNDGKTYRAKASMGENGSIVLSTRNWKD